VAARFGLPIDIVSGPTTDNQVGTDFIRDELGLATANAKLDGERLYELVQATIAGRLVPSSAEPYSPLPLGEGGRIPLPGRGPSPRCARPHPQGRGEGVRPVRPLTRPCLLLPRS